MDRESVSMLPQRYASVQRKQKYLSIGLNCIAFILSLFIWVSNGGLFVDRWKWPQTLGIFEIVMVYAGIFIVSAALWILVIGEPKVDSLRYSALKQAYISAKLNGDLCLKCDYPVFRGKTCPECGERNWALLLIEENCESL